MSNRVLAVADNILSDASRWTKLEEAKDIFGSRVAYDSNSATCFCLSGAMRRAQAVAGASPKEYEDAIYRVRQAITAVKGLRNPNIPGFNDAVDTHFADVKAVIAYAKAM